VSGATLISHGCRLNIAESETIAGLLANEDDLIVVNSCAVTAEAVKTARQAIRRAKRDRPEARVVVTGCAAETEPETFQAMPEVAAVVSNLRKLDLASYPSSQRKLGSISRVRRWECPGDGLQLPLKRRLNSAPRVHQHRLLAPILRIELFQGRQLGQIIVADIARIGVPGQIVLMISLGRIEGLERLDPGDDGLAP
jgi:hypothetical protein